MNSNWLVCWNFGRKSGEPMRPSPGPPKNPSIEIPGRPPATVGFVIEPGIVAASGGARPKGCCNASDFACDQDTRNSLTIEGDRIRVQPPTNACDLMVWLPKAEVPVPSNRPPNAPG